MPLNVHERFVSIKFMETTTTKTVRTYSTAEDFAVAALTSGVGSLTVSEALALGGLRLLNGLRALTKRKAAVVTFERGAYRAVSL